MSFLSQSLGDQLCLFTAMRPNGVVLLLAAALFRSLLVTPLTLSFS